MKGLPELLGRLAWRTIGSKKVPPLLPLLEAVKQTVLDPEAYGWTKTTAEPYVPGRGAYDFTLPETPPGKEAVTWHLHVQATNPTQPTQYQHVRFTRQIAGYGEVSMYELTIGWLPAATYRAPQGISGLTLYINDTSSRTDSVAIVRWPRNQGFDINVISRTGLMMYSKPIIGENWWAEPHEIVSAHLACNLPPEVLAISK